MRGLALILLLSACEPVPVYEVFGCPASPGWSAEDRDALMWEEIQPDFKERYPKAAQALNEYQDAKANRCVYLSGLRTY